MFGVMKTSEEQVDALEVSGIHERSLRSTALGTNNFPLVSKINNIPSWSFPDAATGPAAATSAAASALCI